MRLRVWLCTSFVTFVLASEESRKRPGKLPYVADAIGNTIPPPLNGPATVGSPSKLLVPDRYEFYTFDESGDLVKRLMTLEEIQAIVAAGEGTDGHLVTFANDDQPTIAFNFSQPPFTKVHSVVTNVQNVLKAQMEAQKNNPPSHATLDTPDVSDSWSLILPSIFGNTGVDIVPDKSSNSFSTPETETLELDSPLLSESKEEATSKEDTNNILSNDSPLSTSTLAPVTKTQSTTIVKVQKPTVSSTTISSTTTTTTSPTIIKSKLTAKTTTKSTTESLKEHIKYISSTTKNPSTLSNYQTESLKESIKYISSTTKKPSTLNNYQTDSLKESVKYISSTTKKPSTLNNYQTESVKESIKYISSTTEKPLNLSHNDRINKIPVKYDTKDNNIEIKDKTTTQKFEKLNLITTPLTSTSNIVEMSTEGFGGITTHNSKSTTSKQTVPVMTTTLKYIVTLPEVITTEKIFKDQYQVTTYKPAQHTVLASITDSENNKGINSTTLTTQSVSPSTTVSSTEFMSVDKINLANGASNNGIDVNYIPILNEPLLDFPVFDVAQSISQIATDLGNNFPNPTTNNNLLEITKENVSDPENKENLEIDIPDDFKNYTQIETTTSDNVRTEEDESFIKLSTLDPPNKNNLPIITTENIMTNENLTTMSTTIDPILSESMDDLLSQIVNQVPQSIVPSREQTNEVPISNIKPAELSMKQNLTAVILTSPSTTENAIYLKIENKNNFENDEMSNNKSIIPVITEHIKENITENLKEDIGSNNEVLIDSNLSALQTFNTPKPLSIKNKENNNLLSNKISQNNVQKEDIMDKNNNKISNESIQPTSNISTPKIILNKIFSNISTVNIEQNSEVKLQNISNTNNKFHIDENNTNILSENITKQEIKKKIQKVNIDDEELANNNRNNTWKLISTVSPPKANDLPKDKIQVTNQHYSVDGNDYQKEIILDGSTENQGLEVTTKNLGEDISQFTELCNELAFRYWNTVVENIDKKRSFVLSPYSITSMLAMMFMGARGATSGEMNEILKLDDMVTFNPHFTLKNISDSIETSPKSGVAVSAFIRELYTDRNKGKILNFYKERAQQFYNGHVEEVNFKVISDLIRRRTNLLVKKLTWGKIGEYMKSNSITLQPPLAAFSTNIFETDCTGTSVDGRDGEMYFVVSPNVRQRRLVPVPAVVYKKGFLAGYDPVLDATAAALGTTNSVISTLFLMPGQQGNVVRAEDLETLERRILDANPTVPAWNRLLRTLLPRNGLELQIPTFSHKSTFNISSTLRFMGLKDIFDPSHADLGGVNGPSKDLYLSDMVQVTTFVTCGEGIVGEQHHVEEYPEMLHEIKRRRTSRWATGWDEPRDYQRAFHDPHDVADAMHLPLHLRPRQARVPARNSQPARLKFDRPFLYFVRHNPSGMILYVGRYNPRLLP